jgi:hypothetical protein
MMEGLKRGGRPTAVTLYFWNIVFFYASLSYMWLKIIEVRWYIPPVPPCLWGEEEVEAC